MRFHSQNLNEKGHGIEGSKLRHGRCWLCFSDHKPYKRGGTIELEWSFGRNYCGIGVEIGGEEQDFACFIQIPFIVSLYLTFSDFLKKGSWLEKKLPRHPNKKFDWRITREFSLRIFAGSLWWNIWNYDDEWDSTDPKWMRGCFDFADFFLGRSECTRKELETKRVDVPMPEGVYPSSVVVEQFTHKRPRWFAKHVVRYEVTPDTPIPHPGKGTAEWNCGEDALHSLSGPYRDIDEAVAAVVKSVLKCRRTYPL